MKKFEDLISVDTEYFHFMEKEFAGEPDPDPETQKFIVYFTFLWQGFTASKIRSKELKTIDQQIFTLASLLQALKSGFVLNTWDGVKLLEPKVDSIIFKVNGFDPSVIKIDNPRLIQRITDVISSEIGIRTQQPKKATGRINSRTYDKWFMSKLKPFYEYLRQQTETDAEAYDLLANYTKRITGRESIDSTEYFRKLF